VAHRAKGLGNARGCFDFLLMALAVIKGKGVTFKALLACNGQTCGGIESAAEQTDGASCLA